MTDKQFMEQLVKKVEKLPHEDRYALLFAARAMGMMRQAQADAKSDEAETEEKETAAKQIGYEGGYDG